MEKQIVVSRWKRKGGVFELLTTKVAGFSGRHNLPIRFIEEVSERVEVAKNYRAIPVVPTVR